MNIPKERVKAILDKYKSGDHALFNWCEEYKNFVSDCISCNVSMEWEYMLNKSHEENEDRNPIDFEDLDLFNKDNTREAINYKFGESEKELIEYANNPDTFNRRVKNKEDFKVFVNSLDIEELKELCNNFNIEQDQTDAEVFEWWIIQDGLKYELEQQGEVFLNRAWGRTTTGQSISLDYCVIKAFIDRIKRF